MFFQLPAGVHVDQASLEQQFQQAAGRNAKDWNKTEVVDQLPCSINGQDVMLTITEGVNHDGQTFRQATAMFQGKGGQAMVAYETPVSVWDQAKVDEFLASIH
jgi:hypothetical protein